MRLLPVNNPNEENVADENSAASQAATQDPNTPLTSHEDAHKVWLEEAGLREDPSTKPAPVAAPDPAQATPQEETPGAPVEIPDELRETLRQVDSLKAAMQLVQHKLSSSEGRIGALQRELQAARSVEQYAPRSPNQQTIAAAAKTPEKWAKLKEDFPEWGEAIEELVSTRAPASAAPQVDLEPLQGQLNALTSQFARAIEEAKVFGAHRDWKAVINTPEFVNWHRSQSADVQALAASPAAEDAIAMIDRFKQESRDGNRNVAQERAARLAAAAVPAKRSAAPPPKAESELTATELWAAEAAAREQARARNR